MGGEKHCCCEVDIAGGRLIRWDHFGAKYCSPLKSKISSVDQLGLVWNVLQNCSPIKNLQKKLILVSVLSLSFKHVIELLKYFDFHMNLYGAIDTSPHMIKTRI